jgi:flagellar export protein FliJ
MKPFHFTLEPLRVLRRQQERAAQQRYVQALNACNHAERQLAQAAAELTEGWQRLGHELCAGVIAGQLARLQAWCRTLEIRRDDCQRTLNEARFAAERLRQEMVEAVREREALERFHDKARRAHDREVRREEQKHFDELAVQLNGAPDALSLCAQTH